MNIYLHTLQAGPSGIRQPGFYDVSDEEGKMLIEGGYAEEARVASGVEVATVRPPESAQMTHPRSRRVPKTAGNPLAATPDDAMPVAPAVVTATVSVLNAPVRTQDVPPGTVPMQSVGAPLVPRPANSANAPVIPQPVASNASAVNGVTAASQGEKPAGK